MLMSIEFGLPLYRDEHIDDLTHTKSSKYEYASYGNHAGLKMMVGRSDATGHRPKQYDCINAERVLVEIPSKICETIADML